MPTNTYLTSNFKLTVPENTSTLNFVFIIPLLLKKKSFITYLAISKQHFVLLVKSSIPLPIPHFLQFSTLRQTLLSDRTNSFTLFFRSLLAILGSLHSHVKFRPKQTSSKSLLGFFTGIKLIQKPIWKKLKSCLYLKKYQCTLFFLCILCLCGCSKQYLF